MESMKATLTPEELEARAHALLATLEGMPVGEALDLLLMTLAHLARDARVPCTQLHKRLAFWFREALEATSS
jgi:hypothetical protein